MKEVSLFTSISYTRPTSYTEDALSMLSNYFYLGGKRATVVKGNEVKLETENVSWYRIALKVASFVLLLPFTLTLLASYLSLRYQQNFTVLLPLDSSQTVIPKANVEINLPSVELTKVDIEPIQQIPTNKPDTSKLSESTIRAEDKVPAPSNKHDYSNKRRGHGIFKRGMSKIKQLVGSKVGLRESRREKEISEPLVPDQFPFEPSKADIEHAKQLLANKPSGTKLSRKSSGLKFSFIRADDKMYALSNKHCYSNKHGGYGIFKMGMSEDNQFVGVKIEPRKSRREDDPSLIAAKRMGLLFAQAERNDPNMHFLYAGKAFPEPKKIEVKNKLYSFIKLGGNDLTELSRPLTQTQRHLVSLKLCDLTDQMHKKDIIHGDINPGNILAKIDGNQIEVDLIDFDFSKIVTPPQTSMTEPGIAFGMPVYTAPETKRSKLYSFSSDVYALGMILFFDLDLTVRNYKEGFQNTLTSCWMAPTYFLSTTDRQAYNTFSDSEIIQKMTCMELNQRKRLHEAVLYFSEKLLANCEVQNDSKLLAEVVAISNRAKKQN